MKQLYDPETSRYTKDGDRVLRQMETTIRPMLEALIAEGFPVRDLGALLHTTVGSLVAEKALVNIINDCY